MSKGKKIGYRRVSSWDQNPDRQLKEMIPNLDKVYTDECSGKSKDRPALKSMLDYVRDDDHIYVHSMDRLGRSNQDLHNIVSELNNNNVSITFVKENLTFNGDNSPMDKLMFSIFASFAQFSRDMIKEAQKEGIELAKKRGVYKGKKPKFSTDDVKIIREEHELGIAISKLAKKYGATRATIYKVVKGSCAYSQ